jgi:hypothetical protein
VHMCGGPTQARNCGGVPRGWGGRIDDDVMTISLTAEGSTMDTKFLSAGLVFAWRP